MSFARAWFAVLALLVLATAPLGASEGSGETGWRLLSADETREFEFDPETAGVLMAVEEIDLKALLVRQVPGGWEVGLDVALATSTPRYDTGIHWLAFGLRGQNGTGLLGFATASRGEWYTDIGHFRRDGTASLYEAPFRTEGNLLIWSVPEGLWLGEPTEWVASSNVNEISWRSSTGGLQLWDEINFPETIRIASASEALEPLYAYPGPPGPFPGAAGSPRAAAPDSPAPPLGLR